ncbi:hypothetical protein [Streptomyces sp. NPDC051162]|uniref:hypothetical protein n=1 Tax=unclassified Streptomyces TaxID=2593676 RepID=UPI0034417C41
MLWTLDDGTGRHKGSLIGLPDDADGPPFYRDGRHMVVRLWENGQWTGPADGRPAEPPTLVIPVCACGWESPVHVRLHPDRPQVAEADAEYHWRAHARAATDTTKPAELRQDIDRIAAALNDLTVTRPLAALALLRQLRAVADELTPHAAHTASTHQASWETIGTATGKARQTAHKLYGKKPPAPVSRELATRIREARADGHPRGNTRHDSPAGRTLDEMKETCP